MRAARGQLDVDVSDDEPIEGHGYGSPRRRRGGGPVPLPCPWPKEVESACDLFDPIRMPFGLCAPVGPEQIANRGDCLQALVHAQACDHGCGLAGSRWERVTLARLDAQPSAHLIAVDVGAESETDAAVHERTLMPCCCAMFFIQPSQKRARSAWPRLFTACGMPSLPKST